MILRMLDAKTCIPYIAISKLLEKHRELSLKPLAEVVEDIVPEECKEYTHLVNEEAWRLAEYLICEGGVSRLLNELDINLVREYAKAFRNSYKRFVTCSRVSRDQALYLAVWYPALYSSNSRRFAILSSLLVSTVQTVWISLSRELVVIVLEFVNKAEALSHTRIPHDILITSSTLSALIAYATAKLASTKLSPFLIIRPPPILNPFYYAPILYTIRELNKENAESGDRNRLDFRLKEILSRYAIGIYPAISVILVPLCENNSSSEFDVNNIAKSLIENLRESWKIIVDHVRNKLLLDLRRNVDCVVREDIGKIEEFLKRASKRPPYQYVLSITRFPRDKLQNYLYEGLKGQEKSNVWKFIVDTYVKCHEGISINKYVWAPLYSAEELDPNRVSRINKLCTNCYQLISVIEVKEGAGGQRRYPFCKVGRLVLRSGEKLCVYCLINRLVINPFNILLNAIIREHARSQQ